jgi:type IV pilus assembly protein PilP
VLVLVAVGCDRRTTGPTVNEYRQKRASVIAKHKERRAKLADTATKGAESQRGGSHGGFGAIERAYGYDPTGKRDPFRSFILDRLHEEGKQAKGPLEEYDLSQLEVAGMVWRGNKRRALVIDPSGQGYVVEEGDKIGKNDGRVLEIGDSMMRVREEYVDFHGEKTTKEIDMRIRQSQGG